MKKSSGPGQPASINIGFEVIWRIPSPTQACANHAGQLPHKAPGGLCNILEIKLMALSVGSILHNKHTPNSFLKNPSTFQVHGKIPTGFCQGKALPSLAGFLTSVLIQISPVNQRVVLSIRHKSHHFFPSPLTL